MVYYFSATCKKIAIADLKSKRCSFGKALDEIKAVSIDDGMFQDAITRRLMAPECLNGYLFTQKGHPLSYRSVQYHYEKTLKKAGLYPKFSGTHFLRYTMATESRSLMTLRH